MEILGMKYRKVTVLLKTKCSKKRAEIIYKHLKVKGIMITEALQKIDGHYCFDWQYPKNNVLWPIWLLLFNPDVKDIR